MARRTKADAELTRDSLLDAAEVLFDERGVSRTTLSDIAAAAGLTRGAVYWHFKDKADVFNAVMDRVFLPMEALIQAAVGPDKVDALAGLRAVISDEMLLLVRDERLRRVAHIARHKIEFTTELQAAQQRRVVLREAFLKLTGSALVRAAEKEQVALAIAAPDAARGLHALLDGLIHIWLLDAGSFDLHKGAMQAFDVFVRGLGLAVPKN